jgi:DNA topoisomerase I
VLREFWRDFTAAVEEIADLRVSEVLDALNELLGPHVFPDAGDGTDPRKCPSCDDGRLSLKVGKFGAFIGCSNYPDCRFTRQLATNGEDGAQQIAAEGKVLGVDPDSGLDVSLRSGRFGPYIQLGEAAEGEKPKRSSLPKGMTPEDIDLELALRLVSLPRTVGNHPETGKPITAGIGRYGPFVLHDGIYANLEGWQEVFEIGENRAVALIAEKASKTRGGRANALKELGEHPEFGGPIQVMSGRYGPYVKHGKVNATLPKSLSPEAVTLDVAIGLIAEKAAKDGKGAKKPKAKAAAKKTASKSKAKAGSKAKKTSPSTETAD